MILTLLATQLAFSAEPKREYLPSAFAVTITNRGQAYFRDKLETVLYRNGYSLREGFFERLDYQAEEPFDLDHLPKGQIKNKGALESALATLKTWYKGLEVADPMLSAKIEGLEYGAELRALSLRVDRVESAKFPDGRGLSVVFDAEVPFFQLFVDSIDARDSANDFLIPLRADGFWISTNEGTEPLRAHVPVDAWIDGNGEIRVAVRKILTNLDSVSADCGFEGEVSLPEIEVGLWGSAVKLNQATLVGKLLDQRAKLLASLQSYLADFLRDRLPGLANDLISTKLNSPLTELNVMDPPGAPEGEEVEKFVWGARPDSLTLEKDWVEIGLAAFVEDPLAGKSDQPLGSEASAAAGAATAGDLDPRDYDLALTIGEGFLDRLFQLSFERGYFDSIDAGDGKRLKLASAPIVVAESGGGKNARIRMRLEERIKGIQKWVLRDPVQFEVDLELELRTSPTGGISIIATRVDPSSVRLEDRYLKGKIFKPLVKNAIKGRLKDTNAALKKEPRVLVSEFPVPSTIGGIPIQVLEFRSDAKGRLVLYLEISKTARTGRRGARR